MGSLLGPPVMITFIISTRESKKILVSSKYSAISGLFAATACVPGKCVVISGATQAKEKMDTQHQEVLNLAYGFVD
jgi:hypothetical protein